MILHSVKDTYWANRRRQSYGRLLLLIAYILLFLLIFGPTAEYLCPLFAILFVTGLSLWFGPFAFFATDAKRTGYDPAMIFNLSVFYYSIKAIPISWGEQPNFLFNVNEVDGAVLCTLVASYVAFGLLAWNFAYNQIVEKRNLAGDPIKFKEGRVIVDSSAGYYSVGVLFLTIIGLFCFFMLLRSIESNITFFLMNPSARAYLADPIQGAGASLGFFWLYGFYMLPIANIIWLASFGAKRQLPNFYWWIYTFIITFLIVVISPRAILVGFAISLLITFHILIRRISIWFIAGFGFAAIIYSYFINIWRNIVGTLSADTISDGMTELTQRISISGFIDFLGGRDTSDMNVFVLIASAYGEELPLKYGETFLRVITQFIPRALWPNKPYDLGVEVLRLYDPFSQSGIPPGYFPELYMNFHLVGILLGGLFLGAGCAHLYCSWILHPRDKIIGVLLYSIVAPKFFFIVSATIANALTTTLIALGSAVLALVVSGKISFFLKR